MFIAVQEAGKGFNLIGPQGKLRVEVLGDGYGDIFIQPAKLGECIQGLIKKLFFWHLDFPVESFVKGFIFLANIEFCIVNLGQVDIELVLIE